MKQKRKTTLHAFISESDQSDQEPESKEFGVKNSVGVVSSEEQNSFIDETNNEREETKIQRESVEIMEEDRVDQHESVMLYIYIVAYPSGRLVCHPAATNAFYARSIFSLLSHLNQ